MRTSTPRNATRITCKFNTNANEPTASPNTASNESLNNRHRRRTNPPKVRDRLIKDPARHGASDAERLQRKPNGNHSISELPAEEDMSVQEKLKIWWERIDEEHIANETLFPKDFSDHVQCDEDQSPHAENSTPMRHTPSDEDGVSSWDQNSIKRGTTRRILSRQLSNDDGYGSISSPDSFDRPRTAHFKTFNKLSLHDCGLAKDVELSKSFKLPPIKEKIAWEEQIRRTKGRGFCDCDVTADGNRSIKPEQWKKFWLECSQKLKLT